MAGVKKKRQTKKKESTKISKPAVVRRLAKLAQKRSLKKFEKESLDWLRKAATKVSNPSKNNLLAGYKKPKKIEEGRMLMYFYDPKYKEELPYYDTFPLIIVLSVYNNGFLGINFHYIPPIIRQKLIEKFAKFLDLRPRKRFFLTYDLAKVIIDHPILKHMVKRYLYSHVVSDIVEVPTEDWDKVVFLPTASFKKASKKQVWKEALQG